MKKYLLLAIVSAILFMGFQYVEPEHNSAADNWVQLLDDNHSDFWEVYMGAPHKTVKDLDGVDPNSNGRNSKALGLNNDPKNVFSFEKSGGENILHISGEIYGSITSKQAYGNYHLRLQYKWGEKKWEPRLQRERDSGILYHCTGEHGAFWNVWMKSQEFQVQEGDCGDYYGLISTLIDIPSVPTEGSRELTYQKGAQLNEFSSFKKYPANHCNKNFDNENPHGEWNTVDLICFGDTSLHILNGKVVMALFNSKIKDSKGEIIPLTKGKIQIQCEAAEVFYKNIEIQSVDAIPAAYKNKF